MKPKHPTDEHLIEYALDEMEESSRDAVAAHLRSCNRCNAALETIALVIDSERSAGKKSAPLHVLVDVLSHRSDALHGMAWHERPGLRTALGVAAGFLLVLIFGSGFFLGRQTASATDSDAATHPASPTSQEKIAAPHGATAQELAPLPPPPHVRFTVAWSPERDASLTASVQAEKHMGPTTPNTASDSL